MKISVLPGDHGGCGHYRLIWPAQAVAEIRPDWDVRVLQPKGSLNIGIDAKTGRVIDVVGLDDTDVLVMQRTGTRVLAGIAQWAQTRGIAVVVDFDDAMWCINRQNIAWGQWNRPHGIKQQHWSWCDTVASLADLVTVTTDGLAAHYGDHGRVEVLPNRVPQIAIEVLPNRHHYDDRFAVGWAGYTATHPGDCLISAPAAQAAVEAGAVARVIADGPGAARDWKVSTQNIAAQDLGPDYFAALGSLDLMLVGLQNSSFNRCKSTLKVLEAASAAVPSIASATQPHRQLAKQGFPVTLADSPADWRGHVMKIMADRGLWEALSYDSFHWASNNTIEKTAESWAGAWERAARRTGRC